MDRLPPQRVAALRTLRFGAAAVLLALLVGSARTGERPATNLALMQRLAHSVGQELAAQIPAADSVTVSLLTAPEGLAWVVQGPVREALREKPALLRTTGARFRVECMVTALLVRYEQSRRDWIFGSRKVDRVVQLRCDGAVLDEHAGTIATRVMLERSVRDTIEVAEIPGVEEASVPFTHAAVPPEGFFSWAAEPLIMVGAIAVAVYLLFHVRS